MNIFNKFGLGPKKQQTLPFKGEKLKKEEEAYSLKKNPYIRWTHFWGIHPHFNFVITS